jgi:hypothetical protein
MRPELGSGSRKYTYTDIKRLTHLRNLIVEKKLPLSFVKSLLDARQEESLDLIGELIDSVKVFTNNDDPFAEEEVFDFEDRTIVKKKDIADQWITDNLLFEKEERLERDIKLRALLLFRIMRHKQNHPAAFQDRLSTFLEDLQNLSRVARVEVIGGPKMGVFAAFYDPKLESDGEIDESSLDTWFLPAARLLDPLQEYINRGTEERRRLLHPDIKARFWENDALLAVQRDADLKAAARREQLVKQRQQRTNSDVGSVANSDKAAISASSGESDESTLEMKEDINE